MSHNELVEEVRKQLYHLHYDEQEMAVFLVELIQQHHLKLVEDAILDIYTHNSDGDDYEQRCIVSYRKDLLTTVREALK